VTSENSLQRLSVVPPPRFLHGIDERNVARQHERTGLRHPEAMTRRIGASTPDGKDAAAIP